MDSIPDYWEETRARLAPLVAQLTGDEALAIVRALVDTDKAELAPTLAGMLIGYAQRRDDMRWRWRLAD